jgi:hypothetical protein
METTSIFRMVHCFVVRQTKEKFHSLSNPTRHLHTKQYNKPTKSESTKILNSR